VDAFAWSLVGSVAGVIGGVAAIVFGLVPLLAARWQGAVPAEAPTALGGWTVVAGEIPQAPTAFRPRIALLASLEDPKAGGGVHTAVVCAVAEMRGAGKTQLAAEYARALRNLEG